MTSAELRSACSILRPGASSLCPPGGHVSVIAGRSSPFSLQDPLAWSEALDSLAKRSPSLKCLSAPSSSAGTVAVTPFHLTTF